eukprot:8373821-Lingulodinium_polyedra.AAC.1
MSNLLIEKAAVRDIVGIAETHGSPVYFDYVWMKLWSSRRDSVSFSPRCCGWHLGGHLEELPPICGKDG